MTKIETRPRKTTTQNLLKIVGSVLDQRLSEKYIDPVKQCFFRVRFNFVQGGGVQILLVTFMRHRANIFLLVGGVNKNNHLDQWANGRGVWQRQQQAPGPAVCLSWHARYRHWWLGPCTHRWRSFAMLICFFSAFIRATFSGAGTQVTPGWRRTAGIFEL